MAAFPGDPWRNKEVGISLPDVGRVLAISAVWLDILPLRMYVFYSMLQSNDWLPAAAGRRSLKAPLISHGGGRQLTSSMPQRYLSSLSVYIPL